MHDSAVLPPAMEDRGIAIVGIGMRFPGGIDNVDAFRAFLEAGRDAVGDVPPDRWHIGRFHDPEPGVRGKSVARRGGFLADIAGFDPQFFGISPREAPFIDPQQRLLLETAWEAMEDGGFVLDPDGETDMGVYVGISHNDYQSIQGGVVDRGGIGAHSPTGTAHSIAANRISYCFDLVGPSIAMDTACSSALTAIHFACEDLRAGRCASALAGGVTVMINPEGFIGFSQAGMLSPSGVCRAFDAEADGFVRAEGAGMILLKPATRALADGDRIYAVIRATATNQDGHTNGISLPGEKAQARLVADACLRAGIDPLSIGYAEAHGTGTAVGDPIEARAISEALCRGRAPTSPLWIGSVKTNLGHLETAAGVAGIIKAALAVRDGKIPPSLHFRTPNPHIDFEGGCLRIPTRLEDFPSIAGGPRRACVNSFGFGGANAHAIVEEPPPARHLPKPALPSAERAWPVMISARSEDALRAVASDLAGWLDSHPGAAAAGMADPVYTLGARRNHHAHRLTVPARDRGQLAAALKEWASGNADTGAKTAFAPKPERPLRVGFVMSGQGPQWWGMGRELMETEPVFRSAMERAAREIDAHADFCLLDELARDEADSRIGETRIGQPAIFAIQYALAALWKSWGVEPCAIVGHSVGELAAAQVAGILPLSCAARAIVVRARAMDDCARDTGAMVALALPPDEAAEAAARFDPTAQISAFNGPRSTTISGDREALRGLVDEMESREIFARFVKVRHPFHHPLMAPAAARIEAELCDLRPSAERIPFFSTVTGLPLRGADFDAAYLARGIREPVRFVSAVNAMSGDAIDVWLEIGAHPALAVAIRECIAAADPPGTAAVVSSLRRDREQESWTEAALSLHRLGVRVDFASATPSRRMLRLPAYPWQKSRWWHESTEMRESRLAPGGRGLLDARLPRSTPTWSARLDARHLGYLRDHRVDRHTVFPAAAFIEMALEAGVELFGGQPFAIEDFEIVRPLILRGDAENILLELAYQPTDRTFTIHSRIDPSTAWSLHASGSVRSERIGCAFADSTASEPPENSAGVDPEELYSHLDAAGLHYGPEFRSIRELHAGAGTASGRVALSEASSLRACEYALHPVLLDGALHIFSAAARALETRDAPLKLPVRFAKLLYLRSPGESARVESAIEVCNPELVEGRVALFDSKDRPAVLAEGFRAVSVAAARRGTGSGDAKSPFYHVAWQQVASLARDGKTQPLPVESLVEIAAGARDDSDGQTGLASARDALAAASSDDAFRDFVARFPGHLSEACLCAATDSAPADETLIAAFADGPAAARWKRVAGEIARALASALPEGRPLRIAETGSLAGEFAAAAAAALEGLPHRCSSFAPAFPEAAERALGGFEGASVKEWDNTAHPPELEADLLVAGPWIGPLTSPAADPEAWWDLLAPGGTLVAIRPRPGSGPWAERIAFATRAVQPEDAALAAEGFEQVVAIAPDETDSFCATVARKPPARPEMPVNREAIAPEKWTIFCDRGGTGDALAEHLRERGAVVETVLPSDDAPAWDSTPEPDRIVYMRSLDPLPESLDDFGTTPLLRLAHAIAALTQPGIRVHFVTRQLQPIGREAVPSTDAAAALGLFRVIASELPGVACRAVDLPGDATAADLARLLEIAPDEREIALRGEAVYAPKFLRGLANASAITAPGAPRRLESVERGVVERLAFRRFELPACGDGEALVEVEAGGLNFRDVLKALGLYPAESVDARIFGDEVAGKVIAVGRGVENVRPGDRVFGLAVFGLSTHSLARASDLVPIPPGISAEAAATVPVAFTTAWHALARVARLRPGECVLVHAGAGGVGMAAIQVARHLGAEVIATAGSAQKRQILSRLGASHVFDSRRGDFAAEALAATGGRGVDAVLNSLAGEAIPMGLSCLAEFGRFVEIGKRDIYGNSKLPMWHLRKNASFHVIAMDAVFAGDAPLTKELMSSIAGMLGRRELSPLPYRVFGARDIKDGFRSMASGKHVGKVVASFRAPDLPRICLPRKSGFEPDGDGTYLITGGFGGFGKVLARWLVKRGARHLVLAGRTGGSSPDAAAFLAELRALGADARGVAADVGSRDDVRSLVAAIARSPHPLRGVFHLAMVIDDAPLASLAPDRFDSVLGPKARGARWLDLETRGLDVHAFVLFSSVSAIFGNPAQGNYAAANADLDALAEHRRALGLPALSVNWGALGETGYLARNEKVAEFLERHGTSALAADEVVRALETLLDENVGRAAVAKIDWAKWGRAARTHRDNPTFAPLLAEVSTDDQAPASDDNWKTRLAAAEPGKRQAVISEALQAIVGSVLRVKPASLRPDQPLTDLGLDSLMGVEIETLIESSLGASLPPASLLRARTIGQIAALIDTHLGNAASPAESANTPATTRPEDQGLLALPAAADPREIARALGLYDIPESEAADRLADWIAAGNARLEPLSFPQRELWENSPIPPEHPANNVCATIEIEGEFPFGLLDEALARVVADHECLRTSFLAAPGGAVQVIRRAAGASLPVRDAGPCREQALNAVFSAPFDLAAGPLFRAEVLSSGPSRHTLALVFHHGIADGWALGVFVDALCSEYLNLLRGSRVNRSKPAARLVDGSSAGRVYSDWARAERGKWGPAELASTLGYWRSRLEGSRQLFRPSIAAGPRIGTPLTRRDVTISPEIAEAAQTAARLNRTTLFTVLLTAFHHALDRRRGLADLTVGTPVANRNSSASRDAVGYFSGIVPIRSRIAPGADFVSTVRANHEAFIEDFAHAMPFAELSAALDGNRPAGAHPVFDVRFALQNHPLPDIELPGISTRFRTRSTGTARFDLAVEITAENGALEVVWLWREHAISAAEITGLHGAFEQILQQSCRPQHPAAVAI